MTSQLYMERENDQMYAWYEIVINFYIQNL